ncbi:MAG: DNA phosphorothioation-associated putative methyltransferase [Bryobacterales bacterium]|nr:DNA phosphorothioation-associated putative methyltransferase [Bryobacterales bacterium]
MASADVIPRHRTAIRRFQYSKPISLAVSHRLIREDCTVLDYGCGRGEDVSLLQKNGMKAEGWDPHFRPNVPLRPADVVNLGYVLNVIENPSERMETLRKAYALALRALVVAVRVDQSLDKGIPFQDGLITSRGAFQKIYSQSEFRHFVGETLGVRPHVAGLGVTYAFKEKAEEERYVADTAFRRTVNYQKDAVEEFAADTLGAALIAHVREMGRLPLDEEFDGFAALEENFGSRARIARLVWKTVHPETLDEVQRQRRDELLVALAMIRLQGAKAMLFKMLPLDVQADIKSLWTSYQQSLKESDGFLFGMGNPALVKAAIDGVSFGKKLPEDFYFHLSQEPLLPPLLRLVVFAARQIVGDIECDLIKVSNDGRKVSFLRYPDFDRVPHPELKYSVKVYLPKAAHSFRDYGDSTNPPLLHRKEAFLDELHPDYQRCTELTACEEALGLLSRTDIGFRNGWQAALREKDIAESGYELIAVERDSD